MRSPNWGKQTIEPRCFSTTTQRCGGVSAPWLQLVMLAPLPAPLYIPADRGEITMRVAVVAAVGLVLGCGPGWAQSGPAVYIFDVLRRASYPTAYNRMFKGERGVPTWFATAKAASAGTTTPGRVVSLEGRNEELYTFCKAHECSGNDVAVLFSDDGDRAVGASLLSGQLRMFGNPDFAERQALQRALTEAE